MALLYFTTNNGIYIGFQSMYELILLLVHQLLICLLPFGALETWKLQTEDYKSLMT